MRQVELTLPPMLDGQSGWAVYEAAPPNLLPTPRMFRYPRLMKRCRKTLLWAHSQVEDLWHWLYRVAEKCNDHDTRTYMLMAPSEPRLIACVDSDGRIISNGSDQ